mgnify:CR=1 FL=1
MKHDVPVANDLSDLRERIEWCKQNDEKAHEIARNAANFADKYITKTAIFDYLERIIEQLRGASPQQEG